jgi:hypothetical protein
MWTCDICSHIAAGEASMKQHSMKHAQKRCLKSESENQQYALERPEYDPLEISERSGKERKSEDIMEENVWLKEDQIQIKESMNVRTKEKHLQTEEMLKMSCHSKQQNTVKCAQCSLTISSKYNLRRHMKAVHLKVRDMKCPHCDFSASQFGTLKKHIMCIHPKVSEVYGHKCYRCPLTFPSLRKLRLHIKGVHEKVKDKKGSSPFSSNGQIQKHVGNIEVKMQDKVSKETGNKTVQAKEKQTDVSQTHVHEISEGSQKMKINEEIIERFENVLLKEEQSEREDVLNVPTNEKHLQLEEMSKMSGLSKRRNPVKCAQCSLTISSKDNLKRHLKAVHLKVRDMKCPHCDYSASQLGTLKKHIMCFHPKVSEVSGHKCYRCPLTCPSIRKLRLHIKEVHDEEKDNKSSSPFLCNGQIQKHVGNIQVKRQDKVLEETEHKSVQANEKQTDVSQTPVHSCPYCSKTFTQTSNPSVHMNAVHIKVRDLNCSHCDFTGSQSQSITSHIKNIQQKQRGIKCPHCNYTAFREVYVKKHIESVHSEKISERLLVPALLSLGVNNQGKAMYCKPGTTQARSQSGLVATIKCLYCSDSFTQQTNLRVHVEKMHSDKHYTPPPICYN